MKWMENTFLSIDIPLHKDAEYDAPYKVYDEMLCVE